MIQDLYIECVFESSISSQSFILSLLLKVHAKYNNIRRAGGFLKWRSSERFLICCSCDTKAEILELSRVSAD